MDNHVHLILVPAHPDGLRAPLASVHTTYAQRINRTHEATGPSVSGPLCQLRDGRCAFDGRGALRRGTTRSLHASCAGPRIGRGRAHGRTSGGEATA
jgi:hypothetical protein